MNQFSVRLRVARSYREAADALLRCSESLILLGREEQGFEATTLALDLLDAGREFCGLPAKPPQSEQLFDPPLEVQDDLPF